MDKSEFTRAIESQFTSVLPEGLSEETIVLLSDWLRSEIEASYEKTRQIKKDEIRLKSAVMLFGKKLERVNQLIKILKTHRLLDQDQLLRDLLPVVTAG